MEYKVSDYGCCEFMATYNGGGRRYFKLTGTIILIRKNYIVLEDNEEHGYLILKKDIKMFKPEKK